MLKNWRKALCRGKWDATKKLRGIKGSVRGHGSEWDLDLRRAKRWSRGRN